MASLKIGMIGLDTSHCPAFVKIVNDIDNEFHVPGAKVVKAFPGGSNLFSSSMSRVEGFTNELKELGLEICDSIDAAAEGMDAFFLESVDGRQHLEQFKLLADYGKPVFIDKPLACCLGDAKEIVRLSKEKNAPVMTASAIRYGKGIDVLRDGSKKVEACEAFGPMALLEDYRDYFWYGIHSAETLYSFMGTGCKQVQTTSTDKIDMIVGTWDDGRIGTLRGNRVGANTFGCMVTVEDETKFALVSSEIPYYALMMKKIIPFFQTGKSDIPLEESLEVIAFLEAASQSRTQGGKIIEI